MGDVEMAALQKSLRQGVSRQASRLQLEGDVVPNGFAYIVVYVVVLMDETWVCLKASAKDMVKRKRLCI